MATSVTSRRGLPSAFLPTAARRRAASTAWANIARIMWRCRPVHERTSDGSSRPRPVRRPGATSRPSVFPSPETRSRPAPARHPTRRGARRDRPAGRRARLTRPSAPGSRTPACRPASRRPPPRPAASFGPRPATSAAAPAAQGLFPGIVPVNRVLPGKAALGPKRQCRRRTVVHLGPVAVESLERALNATSPADVGTPITRGAPTRMPGASELASGELA